MAAPAVGAAAAGTLPAAAALAHGCADTPLLGVWNCAGDDGGCGGVHLLVVRPALLPVHEPFH